MCDGVGSTEQLVDATDLPDDKNACTKDVCMNSLPSNPSEAAGTPCGAALVCDGKGACVGCNVAKDCPGVDKSIRFKTNGGALAIQISGSYDKTIRIEAARAE